MFTGRFTDKLELELRKIYKKDKSRYEQIMKKIEEILSQDTLTINHYKNLRNDLSDRKRVHIGKNFVLTFRVDLKNNFILFLDFDDRDNIYN